MFPEEVVAKIQPSYPPPRKNGADYVIAERFCFKTRCSRPKAITSALTDWLNYRRTTKTSGTSVKLR